ncbi:MAG TPA: hypothetical protein VKU42_05500 [Candidatus Angelobacter sp.]|nr:hypothetical protein [Candidatus Angelobacter sp.]
MKNNRAAKFAVLSIVFSLFIPLRLHADEFRVAEVFAGYSLLHGNLQKSASGWEFSGGKNLNQWLSLHADFDGHYQSSAGSRRHTQDFLLGPQFSYRTNHFTLFAHALGGACHAGGSLGSETGFASVAGGGFDWDYNPVLSLRIAQVDYHTAHLLGAMQNDARFSFGIVVHLVEFRDHAPPAPKKPSETNGSTGAHVSSL